MEGKADGRIVRHPDLIAVRGRDRCVLIRPGVRLMTYRGRAAQVVEELVQSVATPASSEQVLARLPGVSAPQLDGLVQQLIGRGLLVVEGEDPGPTSASPRFALGRVLVAACGAVRSAKLPQYLDPLFYSPGTELEVVLTAAAQRFVSAETLTHLYGLAPWTDLFEQRPGLTAPHIVLAKWAEMVLVAPVSAHLLHRLATGAASDLLSLILMATRAPVVLVPGMNEALWRHPSVQRNVRQVIDDGAYVVLPGAGYEVAEGAKSSPSLGGPGVNPTHVPRLLRAVQSLSRSASGDDNHLDHSPP